MTGANENFFKLGDDSAAAMRLIGAARDPHAQLSDMTRDGEAEAIAQADNGPSGNLKSLPRSSCLNPKLRRRRFGERGS